MTILAKTCSPDIDSTRFLAVEMMRRGYRVIHLNDFVIKFDINQVFWELGGQRFHLLTSDRYECGGHFWSARQVVERLGPSKVIWAPHPDNLLPDDWPSGVIDVIMSPGPQYSHDLRPFACRVVEVGWLMDFKNVDAAIGCCTRGL